MLRVCDQDKWKPIDVEQWVNNKLSEKSEIAKKNNFVDELYKTISDDGERLKVAVITDLHIDYGYMPGMNSHCGRSLCCRADSGLPDKPEHTAGKWGDLNCDLNELTANSMFE